MDSETTGMYQICENCYECDLVPGTVHSTGEGDYALEISDGHKEWQRCPSCGIEFDGDTEHSMVSWSIDEPTDAEVGRFLMKRWRERVMSPKAPEGS